MHDNAAEDGSVCVQVLVVGAVANEVGRVISIMAFEGSSEFGVKEIDSVVSAKTTGFAADANETVMFTPSSLGVGKRFV